MVAATVHPLPGRGVPKAPAESFPSPSWGGTAREASRVGKSGSSRAAGSGPPLPTPAAARPAAPHKGAGKGIEPNRRQRIARDREEIGGRIDLHGMTQDRARPALEAFLIRAWDEGFRAILVITGKGVQGDGVLRRRVPEWLGAAHLAHIVAGMSEAHRKHGGEGALYVALKRKARG
nr:Smr/MutS family protein [Phenylobacterium sp.]